MDQILSFRSKIWPGFVVIWTAFWPALVSAGGTRALPEMGFFVDNTPSISQGLSVSAQREAGIRAWEKRLHLPANSLLAEDFYGDGSGTWSGLISAVAAAKPREWATANARRKLLWSIPLNMKGTLLSEVAAGGHDAEFINIAKQIASSQPDAIIRIGWEMNDENSAWFAGSGQEKHYIAAYRRVAGIFKGRSAQFRLDWSTSFGRQNSDAEMAYPGDDVVDTIGMDLYDFIYVSAPEPDAEKRWQQQALDGNGRGLNWLADFAARHHKKMSFAEWGIGLTNDQNSPLYQRLKDNPLFVVHMAEWLRAHAGTIAFQLYFDAPPHAIENGSFPKSLNEFKRLFSAP